MTDGLRGQPAKASWGGCCGRILAITTVLLAIAWMAWARVAADHVRNINATRLLSAALMGEAHPPGTSAPSPLHNLLSAALRPPGSTGSPAATLDPALQARTAWVEGTVHWWTLVMNVAGIILALAGLAGMWSRWRRALLLCAAAVIQLATAGTLVGLWMLMAPHLGGLPRLSGWTFVAVGAGQSVWGFILLSAFARRPGMAEQFQREDIAWALQQKTDRR